MYTTYTTTTATIATGGVAQDVVGANPNRKYLIILLGNIASSANNYYDFGTAATFNSPPTVAGGGNVGSSIFQSPSGSNPIFPGGIMVGDYLTTQAVSVLTDGSGSGDTFTVIEGV